ncbi:hypothetical protein [Halorussus litoreus]|uniref:hypothetical protein n=1 Tax=Halorussus litoreus TaxID=1710536 RepID=UPI000E239B22|nr:hypothetical protein [Halorussus litoreus]
MRPRIDALGDRAGVEIVDPIESHRFLLYTDREASPTPADTAAFAYPVSVASEFVAGAVELPYTVTVVVRDARDGSHVLDVGYREDHELPRDDYLVEVNAPMKLYLRVEAALSVAANTDRIAITFDEAAGVLVGARSHHTSPAATVTVSDDPADAMAAISTFGSGLKTTTCERSWPNLRGHPPRVERGDELSIPDDVGVPDTGVTLHVPADFEHVYAVAPLAYYFGANVVPAETPRVTADTGFSYRLDGERGFEEEVVRFLKRALVLDCVTRTEGFHPMDLHERRVLESHPGVDLDFEALYDAPLGDQLAAYCSVPDEALDAAAPTWHRATHVRPDPDAVELLPYVVDDLSLVRVESPAVEASADGSSTDVESPGTSSADAESPDGTDQTAALESFKRGPPTADSRDAGVPETDEYVPLPDSDAIERAWIGEGTPVHGAKLLRAAFEHDRPAPTDGVIDVMVVCNDEGMREEWDAVSDVYGAGGAREVAPFDVDCRFDVPTDDLRELLAADHDVFHFVGHIDGRGLACPDGILDAETVEQTGATTVLLNACRSHDQGIELVEAGARAAIVSWGDVDNGGAVEVGETFARLLNYGFDVGGALEIVEEYTAIGRHYVVVGDPGVSVSQCVDAMPLRCEFDRDPNDPPDPDESVEVAVNVYATSDLGVGGVTEPYLGDDGGPNYYLVPGRLDTFTNTGRELREMLGDDSVAIDANGTLRWADAWLGGESAE